MIRQKQYFYCLVLWLRLCVVAPGKTLGLFDIFIENVFFLELLNENTLVRLNWIRLGAFLFLTKWYSDARGE